MNLVFFDYEVPVLRALKKLGGSSQPREVYPLVEELMKLKNHPEEYGHYKVQREIIWKNKTQWAREYLKRKGQLDGSQRGIWTITGAGKERLRVLDVTGKDPDEGKAKIEGIDESLPETGESPEKAFDQIEKIQEHVTGDVLGLRGVVYEPTNEQGVILVFAVLSYDLGFLIEGIRTGFPDAILKRKNKKGTFDRCRAEFEFKSSNFKKHVHEVKACDLIICWENDWKDCPMEVLELKSIVKDFK